jgi:hypothetical protein
MDSINNYFGWLVGLIDDGRADHYSMVLRAAWDMEFIYSIPTDSNRAQDGLDLREVYERETSLALPELGPCRVLEFLAALSKRMDYILHDYANPGQTQRWFWQLMTNLRLIDLGDHNTVQQNREIADTVLYTVITRSYDRNGIGGLFPLHNPKEDQRLVEVWYQMHSWIVEHRNQIM